MLVAPPSDKGFVWNGPTTFAAAMIPPMGTCPCGQRADVWLHVAHNVYTESKRFEFSLACCGCKVLKLQPDPGAFDTETETDERTTECA